MSVSSLWRSGWEVYARAYDNGLVMVNLSGKALEVELGKTYYQAFPYGGGVVPADGDVSEWGVDYIPVSSVGLGPNRAAILLDAPPE